MKKITQLYNSRTAWTVLGLIFLAEMPVIQQVLSPLGYHALELALGVLVVYFHLNPSQVYTPAGVTPPAPGQTIEVTQPI